MTTQTACME